MSYLQNIRYHPFMLNPNHFLLGLNNCLVPARNPPPYEDFTSKRAHPPSYFDVIEEVKRTNALTSTVLGGEVEIKSLEDFDGVILALSKATVKKLVVPNTISDEQLMALVRGAPAGLESITAEFEKGKESDIRDGIALWDANPDLTEAQQDLLRTFYAKSPMKFKYTGPESLTALHPLVTNIRLTAFKTAKQINTMMTKSLQGNREHITTLGFFFSCGEGIVALAAVLHQMPSLTRLYFGHNAIGDEGIVALAAVLPSMEKLTELDLGGNKISYDKATAIINALPPTCKYLYLNDRSFSIKNTVEIRRICEEKDVKVLF